MSRPLLIASSDFHISRGAWKSRDIAGDAYHSLEQIVDFAVDNRCPLLAAGDLLDADDPDPVSVGVILRQVGRLERAGVPFYFVVGQHERRVDGTWLGLSDWATHLPEMGDVDTSSEFAEVHDRLLGRDWMPATRLAAEVEAINGLGGFLDDPRNILVFHQVWREFVNFDESAEGSLADVRGCCTIVTGDYHGGDGSKRISRVGDHLVLSPGPIAMMSIDEDPAKSFFVLEERDGGAWEWRRRFLATRAVFQYRALTEHAAAAVEENIAGWLDAEHRQTDGWAHLPPGLRKPIVAVWHWEDEPAVGDAARRFKDEAHVFVRPQDRRKAERRLQEAGLRPGRFRGLLDALDQVVPAGDPRRGDLERLLGATDHAGELAAVKAEFFERA